MNVSLTRCVRLPRAFALLVAFLLPSFAFAQWSLPASPKAGTYNTIQWSGATPTNSPAIVIWVQPPGTTSWIGLGSSSAWGGYSSISVAYNFPTAGLWYLKIATVDSTPITVSLTTMWVYPPAPDTIPPSTPGAPSGSNVTSNSVTLSWTGSTDNVGVTGYEVFQNGASVTTVSGTSVGISGLSASTTYSFQVRARDAAGNWSSLSAAASVTTGSGPVYVYINGWTLPANPVIGQGYPIAWQGSASGASYVALFYRAPGSSTWSTCGSGGQVSPGYYQASGGWGPSVTGTYEFGVAPGGSGATPTSASATLTVP